MSDHITWRVYCRAGSNYCGVIPRLSRKQALAAATEHAERFGHRCEVVRVQFDVRDVVDPSADAIGQVAEGGV